MIHLKPAIIRTPFVCFKCRKVYKNRSYGYCDCSNVLIQIGGNAPKHHLIGKWKKLCRKYIDRNILWDYEFYYYSLINKKHNKFKRHAVSLKYLECDRYLLRRKYLRMLM